ncbi:unnamed protein product [Larinioides sclopetarius]|uniref:C2H2-type domain-containing protein n=1 Tax=Larinioides sclopetarius TaxID=280406 RepID=A0AAV2B011_9ARAC
MCIVIVLSILVPVHMFARYVFLTSDVGSSDYTTYKTKEDMLNGSLLQSLICNDEGIYTCANCTYATPLKNNLLRHYRVVHSEDRPYICSVCFRSFSLKQSLKIHFRTHTGERPFVCKKCHKTFIQKCHLNAHICQKR